jgi:hypothetical protein
MDRSQHALEAAGVEFTNGDQPGVRLSRAAATHSRKPGGAPKPLVTAKSVRGEFAKAATSQSDRYGRVYPATTSLSEKRNLGRWPSRKMPDGTPPDLTNRPSRPSCKAKPPARDGYRIFAISARTLAAATAGTDVQRWLRA